MHFKLKALRESAKNVKACGRGEDPHILGAHHFRMRPPLHSHASAADIAQALAGTPLVASRRRRTNKNRLDSNINAMLD